MGNERLGRSRERTLEREREVTIEVVVLDCYLLAVIGEA